MVFPRGCSRSARASDQRFGQDGGPGAHQSSVREAEEGVVALSHERDQATLLPPPCALSRLWTMVALWANRRVCGLWYNRVRVDDPGEIGRVVAGRREAVEPDVRSNVLEVVQPRPLSLESEERRSSASSLATVAVIVQSIKKTLKGGEETGPRSLRHQ